MGKHGGNQGGRPRGTGKSIEEHRLAGSYRKDRHDPKAPEPGTPESLRDSLSWPMSDSADLFTADMQGPPFNVMFWSGVSRDEYGEAWELLGADIVAKQRLRGPHRRCRGWWLFQSSEYGKRLIVKALPSEYVLARGNRHAGPSKRMEPEVIYLHRHRLLEEGELETYQHSGAFMNDRRYLPAKLRAGGCK